MFAETLASPFPRLDFLKRWRYNGGTMIERMSKLELGSLLVGMGMRIDDAAELARVILVWLKNHGYKTRRG